MYLAREGLGWNGLDAKALYCKGLAGEFGGDWAGLESPVAEQVGFEPTIRF